MATSAWRMFRRAKERLFEGGLDFSADTFTMHFYRSGSNITDLNLSQKTSITSEVSSGEGGYTQSGFTLANLSVGRFSNTIVRWDFDDVVMTASGADISQVRFALIKHSTIPVMYSELSTAGFNISSGNTLTIQIDASGGLYASGAET